MKDFFVLIAAIALLTSCRSTRTISKAVSKKDTTFTSVAATPNNVVDTQQLIRATLQQVQANSIKFITFSAKVEVDYEGTNGKGYGVNANIKMHRDSAIWISAN